MLCEAIIQFMLQQMPRWLYNIGGHKPLQDLRIVIGGREDATRVILPHLKVISNFAVVPVNPVSEHGHVSLLYRVPEAQ